MPLSSPELLGTNKDHTHNGEYCTYCFQDGAFTSDATMDEMIAQCAEHVDDWKTEDGKPITKEEAIAQMKQYFPMLKRWKS